ncbi:hypothetical protein OUZ56_022422 [Daphnia magna]|uniref:Uncharacterized protein n=1 Tax=Daphnia magna TaxID=35525 RepID=A0ABR0AWH7_9CRUS|nr:hypothetical protein OUZ56_022422 [Daphnia magna]
MTQIKTLETTDAVNGRSLDDAPSPGLGRRAKVSISCCCSRLNKKKRGGLTVARRTFEEIDKRYTARRYGGKKRKNQLNKYKGELEASPRLKTDRLARVLLLRDGRDDCDLIQPIVSVPKRIFAPRSRKD